MDKDNVLISRVGKLDFKSGGLAQLGNWPTAGIQTAQHDYSAIYILYSVAAYFQPLSIISRFYAALIWKSFKPLGLTSTWKTIRVKSMKLINILF